MAEKMRNALKISLGTAGIWIPVKWLIRITGQDLVLPYYHTVSDEPMPHVDRVYPVRSLRTFLRDLEFFLRHYQAVGLEELRKDAWPPGRSRPAMFLSFDDGLSEIYHVVAPLLSAKGIPAAFFVNTDFIDNRDLFYRYKASLILNRLERMHYPPSVTELMQSRFDLVSSRASCIRDFLMNLSYEHRKVLDDIAGLVDLDFKTFLRIKKPYMSLQQVRELAEQGFYIGSHSKDHPRFADIPAGERTAQYKESMDFIREKLGVGHRIFSFPFSDVGVPAEFFRELSREGGPEASFGTAGLKTDPENFHYHRIQMESGRSSARRLIKGEYLYYMLKAPAGKNVLRRT
jgi:peptidoglycan/xylan/chitin deacetylase (PgdA/CDA1 family)